MDQNIGGIHSGLPIIWPLPRHLKMKPLPEKILLGRGSELQGVLGVIDIFQITNEDL